MLFVCALSLCSACDVNSPHRQHKRTTHWHRKRDLHGRGLARNGFVLGRPAGRKKKAAARTNHEVAKCIMSAKGDNTAFPPSSSSASEVLQPFGRVASGTSTIQHGDSSEDDSESHFLEGKGIRKGCGPWRGTLLTILHKSINCNGVNISCMLSVSCNSF